MRRFILQQNIQRFRGLLAQGPEPGEQTKLLAMLHSEERELALFDAMEEGVWAGRTFSSMRRFGGTSDSVRLFQGLLEAASESYLVLDPGPGLHIVDINDAYADATMTKRAAVAGERVFDVFPENPDDPFADGVSNAFASFQAVAETGHAQTIPIQRYDVRTPEGVFVTRYWKVRNSPVFSDEGRLRYVLHQVEDVSADVR